MRVYNVASATVVLETKSAKILVDPWLVDGEYYGSWHHYPPLELDAKLLESITHIYISHIHPDHLSVRSLELLDRKIPVLIHSYDSKFLKANIERIGFDVVELPNGESYYFTEDEYLTIYAADNCNPELCSKFLGCAHVETKYQSTQIDSLMLLTEGNKTVLNLNDCPIDLTRSVLPVINKKFGQIDFLLVGYCGAGPFPQCFQLSEYEMKVAGEAKSMQFLNQALEYIELIKPKYFMPFAGTYVLAGKLHKLNNFRGIPELHEALDFLNKNCDSRVSSGILLNQNEFFDITDGSASKPYLKIDVKERADYISNNLKNILLDYERDEVVYDDLVNMAEEAFRRVINKKNQIGFKTRTKLFIQIDESKDIMMNLGEDSSMEIVNNGVHLNQNAFVRISLDKRLLFRLLKGPRYAHWNNAEIGSHLRFERYPNIYERGLYHILCFFHI